MPCQGCESERVASVGGKCSDLFWCELGAIISEDSIYVPGDWGIGGGDYIQLSYCLDCGQIQGEWPLEETVLEAKALDG